MIGRDDLMSSVLVLDEDGRTTLLRALSTRSVSWWEVGDGRKATSLGARVRDLYLFRLDWRLDKQVLM